MSNSGNPSSSVPLPSSKRGFKSFWVEVVREMKKVTWPPVQETNRLTGIVLAVCILLILILTGFHLISGELIKILVSGF
jgi:preprotein translocase SecE subunit